MTIIKAGDYVALRDVPDALWKVEEVNPKNPNGNVRYSTLQYKLDFPSHGGGTVDVSNSAFAAYEQAVSVDDITKHVTKAEAEHIRRKA